MGSELETFIYILKNVNFGIMKRSNIYKQMVQI